MFPKFEQQQPAVIAHRGGAGLWPENTLCAFQRSLALGADLWETDLHLTKDGVIVIIHDETVDRTTNGTGRVADLTLAELKVLDAGFWWTQDDGETYPFRGQGLTIPTLEELFLTFPQRPMSLEIKSSDPKLLTTLKDLIEQYGMQDYVLVSCFTPKVIQRFRRISPTIATAAAFAEARFFWFLSHLGLSTPFGLSLVAFEVPKRFRHLSLITPRFIRAAHRQKLRVDVWTINEVADMQHLLALGVDGILTDYPDRLLQLLGQISK